jgi:hypothetical protein
MASGVEEGVPGERESFSIRVRRSSVEALEELLQEEQGEHAVEMTSPAGEKVQVAVTAALGVSNEDVEKVVATPNFLGWVRSIEEDPKLFIEPRRGIHVQSVDMFGPRVGFVKFKAAVSDDRVRPGRAAGQAG